jgi:hypothetical protein
VAFRQLPALARSQEAVRLLAGTLSGSSDVPALSVVTVAGTRASPHGAAELGPERGPAHVRGCRAQRRNWARIVSAVFFDINTLDLSKESAPYFARTASPSG